MTSESPARSTVEEASTPTQSKAPTPKHVFEGHKGDISSIVFLHHNVHVVSGSHDGTMCKWNCDTGLIAGEPWEGEGGGVCALALSPDGKTIACGRQDGSVQRWNTDGEMIEGVWRGHSDWVRSLSWSPSGSQLASGSDDRTILIRNAESGEVDVGPIKTEQDYVLCLAYSPVGDRIASGGHNKTICIWDSKTGELILGPIEDLGSSVTSLAWSLDGTKLYSASDVFARVLDSASGAELHRFRHDRYLCSIALSPKGNVFACVGNGGVAQLWDTETHQQLGQPFGQEKRLYFVSFSPDGRYLAHGGENMKMTLWSVNEIAPELAVGASSTIEDAPPEDEETRPESPSSSFLDLDAKNPRGRPGDHEGEGNDNRHKNFFLSSKSSLALPSSDANSHPFYRRFWTIVNPFQHLQAEAKTLPSKEKRHKHNFFRRRGRDKSPLQVPATTELSARKVQEGEHVEESDCPGTSRSDAGKKKDGKGKQREDSPTDAQTRSPYYPSPPTEDLEDEHDLQSSTPSGPSRRHAPETESIPLRQRPKLGFFARHSGPRPVTIYAGKQKMLRYTSRRAYRTKSSSAAAHQPHSTTPNQHQQQKQPQQQPQPQPQPQSRAAATQPASPQRKEYNFGFWGNFRLRLALCCTPDGTDIVAVLPAAS